MVEDILKFIFFIFQRKQVDISCELSAKQTIHMKCQDLFSLKNKKNYLSSATVVIGAIRVNIIGASCQ